MKKVALSLAGVLAAAAFAPEASAIPAFARQTGMACNACHQQHFPVLNGFGRAFKAAGYTMVGGIPMVEGEHLSIPQTMNSAILLKYRYQKRGEALATPAVGGGTTAATNEGNGMIQMGDEFSLFLGGRVADNIGFLLENNLGAANAMPLVAGLRLPITVAELGDTRISAIPFGTDGLGVQYGFELSSGGVMRANRWAEQRRAVSAVQYNADRGSDGGNASGVALVVQNDIGFINVSKWSPSFFPGANGGAVPSTTFGNSYIRVAATPTVGEWAIVGGVGIIDGASYGNLAGANVTTKETFADFQAHGKIADKEAGIYVQYANAPAATDLAFKGNNAYNTGIVARTAFTAGVDVTVVEHTLSLGAAYRNAKNGNTDDGTVNGNALTDNGVTVQAIYDLRQNVALHASYTVYSGTAYNGKTGTPSDLLLMLEAAW